MNVKTTSIRIDEKKLRRLDRVAAAMDRPRAWVVDQAIDRFLEYEEWFVRQVDRGIVQADRGDLVPHDDVMAELKARMRKSGR